MATLTKLDATGAPQLIIEPSKGWAALGLTELWEYRDLLYFMVWRDLKSRYRQTALGPLWYILQPLMSTFLYTLIFGVVARLPSENVPYVLFNYTALLPWTLFSNAVTAGSNCLTSNMNLISKVYFSRLVTPLSQLLSGLVDLAVSFVILLGMLVWFQVTPNWGVLLLPVFMLIAAAWGLGVGLWFSGLIVRFKDVGQVLGYIVRVWMYITPVVYSIENIPEKYQFLYRLNPMVSVVEGVRWAMLGTAQPDWASLVISGITCIPILWIGLYIFRRVERSIVDVA